MLRPSFRRIHAARCALTLLFAVVAVLVFVMPTAPALAQASGFVDTYNANKPLELKDADLQGTACLVMDRATGRVLYDKNAYAKRYPASTTKIMTLLLALEYGHLNDIVTLPPETDRVPADSSRVPVFGGEQLPFVDLLYGMMMRSGNDASNAVAVIVGGSISGFADMMNARAKELGCLNTNFVNAHGYHDDEHYSTAYDMALITKQAMRHDTFRAIVGAKTYSLPPTHLRPTKLRLETSNSMFVASSQYYYAPLVGVKTGLHSKAGNCFVGAAKKDDINLISVTFKAPVRTALWMDTARLMDYGFARYQTYTFEDLYAQRPIKVSIQNADRDDADLGILALSAVPGGSINGYRVHRLPDEYEQTLDTLMDYVTVEYTHNLRAPIREGDIIGSIKMADAGDTELSTQLIASRDVFEQTSALDLEESFPILELINFNMGKALLALLALIILLIILLRIRIKVRANRRRKQMYLRRRQAYDRYRADR